MFVPRGPRVRRWALAGLAVGAAMLMGLGCTARAKVHPALRVEGEEVNRAVRRAQSLIKSGYDPCNAYTRPPQPVNQRVSAYVILREATWCVPKDEVVFLIAQEGDVSDAGIRKAVRRALKTVQREMKFTAVVQMPKDSDPASLEFLLRTNTGAEYPALKVEEPVRGRGVRSFYDRSAPDSAMYHYVVRFPARGGPGVPPIGPSVSTLYLVVRSEGGSEARAEFSLPRPR